MKKKLLLVLLTATMLLSACGKEEIKNVPDSGTSEENKNENGTGFVGDNNNNPVPSIAVNYAGPEIVYYDIDRYSDLETPATGVEKLINLDDFTIMDSVFERSHTATNNGLVGFDQNAFYNISYFNSRAGFKLDFNTGILEEYCDVPDCRHGYESEDCMYKTDRIRKIHTADGYYEFIDDTLYYTQTGGEPEEVYKNEYYNEYGETNHKNKKTNISGIIKENTVYLHGVGWIQKLSLDTFETTEPIDIGPSRYEDVVGDLWFSVNTYEEGEQLYCYDLISGEVTKLDDNVQELMCTKKYVYYTRLEETTNENGMYLRSIYRINIEGMGNPEKIVENTCLQFYVSDSHIFYAVEGDGIYMSDSDGQNPKKLDTSFYYKDGTEYKIENQSIDGDFLFTSCDTIDYLFILDNITLSGMNEDALFIVNKETGEVIPVSLGIFYIGDGYEGEFVDETGLTMYIEDSGHTLTY